MNLECISTKFFKKYSFKTFWFIHSQIPKCILILYITLGQHEKTYTIQTNIISNLFESIFNTLTIVVLLITLAKQTKNCTFYKSCAFTIRNVALSYQQHKETLFPLFDFKKSILYIIDQSTLIICNVIKCH